MAPRHLDLLKPMQNKKIASTAKLVPVQVKNMK